MFNYTLLHPSALDTFRQHDAHVWDYDYAKMDQADEDEDEPFTNYEERPWTDEDEAGLYQFEEDRRARIAEANEW